MNIFIYPRPKRVRQKAEPVEFVALLYPGKDLDWMFYSEHTCRETAERCIRRWIELDEENNWGEVIIP